MNSNANAPARTRDGTSHYHARRISKPQIGSLRKRGTLTQGVLIDYCTGFLIVEPIGSDLGDGEVLAPEVADYEIQEVWCRMPKAKLAEARRLLGLLSPT
jgi:hypothetical protein